MAEEQANVAPAEAEAKAPESEANSTNTNEAETKAENTLTLTPEQEKIINANGGFEKFFNTAKSAISNPEKKEANVAEDKTATKAPEEQVADAVKTAAQTDKPQEQEQAQQKTELPKGVIDPEAFMAQQYFNSLSKEKKYEGIAKEIRSGELLKEMSAFGIHTMESGGINDQKIRMYLDLKAKTVHTEPTSTPAATATPTVDYVKTGDKITSRAEAEAVIAQSAQLGRDNQEQHPKLQEAWDFVMGVKPKETKE